MRTISSLLSATARSSANSATVLGWSSPSSKISIVRRQAACWLELISPKYNTWRWTTFPPATRLFSTMEKDSCSLPFFLRRIERKNMAPDYAKTSQAGKRVGRHYRPFQPLFEVRCPENQAVTLHEFLGHRPNPRTRVKRQDGPNSTGECPWRASAPNWNVLSYPVTVSFSTNRISAPLPPQTMFFRL